MIPELLFSVARRFPNRPAIWHRGEVLTYADYATAVRAFAEELSDSGVRSGDRIGLRAKNSPGWLIADLGVQTAGAMTVPIHAAVSDAEADRLLEHCGACTCLGGVDDTPGAWSLTAPRSGSDRGAVSDTAHDQASDLRGETATIVYTSGTTDEAKGVVLTHDNLLSNVAGAQEAVPFTQDDVMLSWLPFSHIYSRISDAYRCIAAGCTLAIVDDPDDIPRICRDVRPTLIRGVPRFYEKMLGRLDEFGDRMRLLFVGGAPLMPHVEDAYRDAGLELIQGYGLTETSPTATVNRPGRTRSGSVGLPIPGCEIRIGDDG